MPHSPELSRRFVEYPEQNSSDLSRQETIHSPHSIAVVRNTVIPRLTKIIRSGITFVSRNVISRKFL